MLPRPLSPRLLAYLITPLLCLKTTCSFVYLLNFLHVTVLSLK